MLTYTHDVDTHDIAFASMCIIEVLDMVEGRYPCYETYRGNNGICETRNRIIALAPYAELVWRAAMDEGYESPFDFEFIPLFLDLCTTAKSEDDDVLKLSFNATDENIKLMGQYLAMLDTLQNRESVIRQGMRELASRGTTIWTPEKIKETFK